PPAPSPTPPPLRRRPDPRPRRIDAARRGAGEMGPFEAEDASAWAEEAEAWEDEPGRPTPPALAILEAEALELERYAARAESIRVNAKGEALNRALDRLFTVARAHQWPEKAVVFTESRRTQSYLADPLAAHGAGGRLSLLFRGPWARGARLPPGRAGPGLPPRPAPRARLGPAQPPSLRGPGDARGGSGPG